MSKQIQGVLLGIALMALLAFLAISRLSPRRDLLVTAIVLIPSALLIRAWSNRRPPDDPGAS